MSRPNRGAYIPDKPNKFGQWELHWTENGRSKRRSTGCTDHGDAQIVLAQFILLKARKDVSGDAESLPMTVAEALGDPEAATGDDYWHEHVLPSVIGKDTQNFAIDKLHKHYGPIAIRDLKPTDTISYIEKRIEGDLGQPSVNSTIVRELNVLSAAINHAAKHRRSKLMLGVDQNVPIIAKPVPDGPRDRWLRFGEAEAALSVARSRDLVRLPRIFVFMMLALHTAARSHAIRSLTWFQVDLDRRLISFNPAGRAQTNKRRPAVAISDTLLPVLIQAKKENLSMAEDRRSEYVLGEPGSVRKAFNTVIRDAGLRPPMPWLEVSREPTEDEWRAFWQQRVTPHTFRHTWATWAAQRGESMFSIAGVLGDTIKTVEKNYAHHHPDHQKQTVNATPKIGAL